MIASTVSTADALSHKRVLIVDDEDDSREILRMILEASGAEVVEASNAFEAVEVLRTLDFDLLISDIGMPARDGCALIRGVRAMPDYALVPAIALTAFVRDEDRARALSAGFDAYLTKPVDACGLIATVASLTRRCRGARRL